MLLNEIIEMWKVDCQINDNDLSETTLSCAKIHAKYLELFTTARLQLKRNEMEMDKVRKDKWLYFGGKMTKEDMDARGWDYDPFKGMSKPLKGDMDMFYRTDPDIVRVESKIQYQKAIVETLEEIMNTLKWRHSAIRNVLDWKKFTSGA